MHQSNNEIKSTNKTTSNMLLYGYTNDIMIKKRGSKWAKTKTTVTIDAAELDEWNWGAFWLTFIWGIRHGVYMALLALVPVVNIVVMFYLGFKGSALAAKHSGWTSLEAYHKSVKAWNRAGWVYALVMLCGSIWLGTTLVHYNEVAQAHQVAVRQMIQNDEEASKLIGLEFELKDYTVSKLLQPEKATRNLIAESSQGTFFVLIRTDEALAIRELVISDLEDLDGEDLVVDKD